MNTPNGQDYYSYMLMDPAGQNAKNFMKAAAKQRNVSGANTGSEELLYQRACVQAIKEIDPKVSASVVVAHYDEDLSWMSGINPGITKFVYSKGDHKVGIPLPNVGRDYNTYLYHIIRHWNNLTDVVFFLQGWPLDRSAHVVTSVNWLRHFHYIEFGTNILETGPVGDQLLNFMGHIFQQNPEGYSRIPWAFRANTQFGASKSNIQRMPTQFWERCLIASEKGVPELEISVETTPYLFEQVWHFIFSSYAL